MPQQIEVPGTGIVEFPDGMSDDAIASAIKSHMATAEPQRSKTMDFIKSIPRGALSGLSGALSAGGQAEQLQMGQPVDVPSDTQTRDILEKNITGKLPEPQGRAGRYGEAVGGVLGNPATYFALGGVVKNVASSVAGALGSEAAGQATEGTKYEPAARIAGALAGPVGLNVAQRAITPLPASAERAALVQQLEDRGVTSLTAGEKTGSKTLQSLESKVGNTPGTMFKAEQIADKGKEQFTRATMRDVGESGMATQPELQAAKERIGAQFNDLSARNSLNTDTKMVTDLINTASHYDNVLDALQKPVFDKILKDVVDKAVAGGMTGTEYQIARSQLGGKARGLQVTDPESAKAFKGLQRALDDAMERGLSDADKIAWRKARDEYGRLKDIEGSVAKSGDDLVEGVIDPAALNRSISTGKDASAAARGQLPYSETARAGAGVMVDPVRPALQHPTLGGLTMAIPNVLAGRALMSKPGQAYLANQLLSGDTVGRPSIAAIAEALRAAQR